MSTGSTELSIEENSPDAIKSRQQKESKPALETIMTTDTSEIVSEESEIDLDQPNREVTDIEEIDEDEASTTDSQTGTLVSFFEITD